MTSDLIVIDEWAAFEKKHFETSASGAHRWMRCPASVAASRGVADKSSAAADEGTLAHEIAAHVLLAPDKYPHVQDHPAIEDLGHELAPFLQEYVDYVRERAKNALLFVEVELDLSPWLGAGGFGTSDAILYFPNRKLLTVIDLKFGQGNLVFANERVGDSQELNPQLGIYALGAHRILDHLDIEELELVVHQPRRENISVALTTPADLLGFGESVKFAIERVIQSPTLFVPGETQCKWCPIRATCAARKQWHIEAFAREVQRLSPAEVAHLLNHLSDMRKWCDDLERFAMTQLETDSRAIPGWKVVRGRGLRQWNADAETVLGSRLGDNAYERKLIGITAAEKLLEKHYGKETAKVIMPEITVKSSGKPALVPESDPRTAITDARDGFSIEAV